METHQGTLSSLDLEMIKAIDHHLEELYESKVPQMVAQKMVDANLQTSQVRGLENLVMSTRRFSEIINYIKNQSGKDRKGQWTHFVDELLHQLEDLEIKAKGIGKSNPSVVLEIKRRLARGWVKQIVAHYFFSHSLKKEEDNAG